jgi:hypothetical protein
MEQSDPGGQHQGGVTFDRRIIRRNLPARDRLSSHPCKQPLRRPFTYQERLEETLMLEPGRIRRMKDYGTKPGYLLRAVVKRRSFVPGWRDETLKLLLQEPGEMEGHAVAEVRADDLHAYR